MSMDFDKQWTLNVRNAYALEFCDVLYATLLDDSSLCLFTAVCFNVIR